MVSMESSAIFLYKLGEFYISGMACGKSPKVRANFYKDKSYIRKWRMSNCSQGPFSAIFNSHVLYSQWHEGYKNVASQFFKRESLGGNFRG